RGAVGGGGGGGRGGGGGVEGGRARPQPLAALEAELTAMHADAVRSFLAEVGQSPADIDVIGFHGHTVLHAPERGVTVQLGDGAALARATRLRGVYHLRPAA